MKLEENSKKNTAILSQIPMPEGFSIRMFEEKDFSFIQELYKKEGWVTILKRPEDALKAWKNSNLVLVAIHNDKIIGVIRALTDTEITTYVIELLIEKEYRSKGIGKSLIDTCHLLYPNTRIEVLASESSEKFYKSFGFRDYFGFRKSYR